MVDTQIIRPDSTVQNTPPWTITGGTAHAVLADESDATFIGASATASAVLRGPNHVVPVDHERHRSRVGFRIAATSGTPKFRGMGGAGGPLSSLDVTAPATVRDYDTEVPWQFSNQPTADAVSEFDPVRLSSTGNVRCYKMWVEVDSRHKPTFEIQGFQGGAAIPDGGVFDATNRPRFQFNNCQYDGLTARAYTVKVRTPGGSLIWQITGAGMPTSVTAPAPMSYLPPGIYVAEFTISSTIRGTAEYVSDVVTYNFSVTYESIDSQIVLVEPNCELGGYIITVEVGDLPPPPPAPPRPAITSATLFGAWDAASLDGVLDHGDSVGIWADETGLKKFDVAVWGQPPPSYVQGGQPGSLNELSGIKFENGQAIRGNMGVANHPRTFFYVMHTPPHDDNVFTYLYGADGSGWVHLASWNSPANRWVFGTNQFNYIDFSEAGFHDSPHLFTFVHKATNPYVRVDQSQKSTAASMVMDTGGGRFQLGETTNIAGPNFIMYELLVYEGEVSPADIDLIEDYLFTKWFTPLTPAEIPEMTVMRHDLITGGLEPVRGLTNLEPNTNYRIVDYEAPSNHEVAYWLYEGGPTSEVPIGGGTLPTAYLQDACTEQMYLRWLLNPSVIASNFCLGPIGELSYAPRSGVFPVIGRADPVVVNDRQETARGTLRFIGQTTAEVNQLRKMLTKDAQPTLLTIHESYMLGREGQLYFQPLAVKEEWLNPDNRIPMHALTVDYVEIAPPAGTAPLEPPPTGIQFGAGGWIVWDTDPPTGIPHGDPLDKWQSFQHLLSSDHTFESALYDI